MNDFFTTGKRNVTRKSDSVTDNVPVLRGLLLLDLIMNDFFQQERTLLINQTVLLMMFQF